MALRRVKKMPDFVNVTAGATAIAVLPIGLSYHRLWLRYTAGAAVDATQATFAADIDEVRINLDGEVIVRLTGAELNMLNNFYNLTHVDGAFPLMFSRPWLRTVAGEDAVALGTTGVNTLTIEVDINAAATTPTLDLYAIQGDPMPVGTIITCKPYNTSVGATGQQEIANFAKGPYAGWAMHFNVATIDDVRIEANQRTVYEADTVIATADVEEAGRNWQTGFWHVDFVSTNRVGDGLPLDLQDFRLVPNFTATGAVKILLERAENREVRAAAAAQQ